MNRGCQVAQTASLLYRGLAIREAADCQSAKQQVAHLRYKPVHGKVFSAILIFLLNSILISSVRARARLRHVHGFIA